ncbi:MAG: CRISPR-associated Cse3 family protein [Elusimicrobia bacterium]|nr:MAG: CRISPR-associated Cse3 family protein [Elusimicrobiota bacterium]KAF0157099.1 MAG: CRISPR-associated Cse3 family protein [Elusimicrobiota bacterium]
MYLHRIHLDPRSREARRDLADPYEMHSTLCRAFSAPDIKCPEGEFLWRLEPETDGGGNPRVIIQSRSLPDWSRIAADWFSGSPAAPVNILERLRLNALKPGAKFRFRLRANPSVTRNGKRLGLLRAPEQELWLDRKGREQHGFALPYLAGAEEPDGQAKRVAVRISQERMLHGRRRNGIEIRLFSALYDGVLNVTEPEAFRAAFQKGIGHGKTMGLGLLSIVPVF